MRSRPALSSLLIALLLAGACKRQDQATSKANSSQASGHHHEHIAPHGGTVIVLGAEAFHLELVHEPIAGRLTLYVLDGHLEDFIRLPAAGIETTMTVGGINRSLTLQPVAQVATGETAGDTSQFAGEADWLKTPDTLAGVIPQINVRGQRFLDVNVKLPGRVSP